MSKPDLKEVVQEKLESQVKIDAIYLQEIINHRAKLKVKETVVLEQAQDLLEEGYKNNDLDKLNEAKELLFKVVPEGSLIGTAAIAPAPNMCRY